MSAFKICVRANVDACLACRDKGKSNNLDDHHELNKGSFLEMIDPEGSHHHTIQCATINNFTLSNKRSVTTAGTSSSACVGQVRTSTKAVRCTDVALNPNHGV